VLDPGSPRIERRIRLYLVSARKRFNGTTA